MTALPHGRKGVDHLAENAHERFYVELERRSPKTWEHGPFPVFARNSKSITIPERRNRYGKDTLIVTVNRDITHGVIIFWTSLLRSRLAEHPNRYVQAGELFYFVPYKECLPVLFPAKDSRTIAELNLAWKREQYSTYGRDNIGGAWLRLRLLELQPYGMPTDEWHEKIDTAERTIERMLRLR